MLDGHHLCERVGEGDLSPKTDPGQMLGLGAQKEDEMPRKKHTPEQIIMKLREAEVAMSTGRTVVESVRQIGVTEQTLRHAQDRLSTAGVTSTKG